MNFRLKASIALLFLMGVLGSISFCSAESMEILAIGDSQTNGRGIPQSSAYPAQLEGLLRSEGYDLIVRNAGIDGDRSREIFNRLKHEVNDQTKIVLFMESGNDGSPSEGIEYTEKALGWLQEQHIPCILISNKRVQTPEEASLTSQKFGAIYYGPFRRGVPDDSEHVQPGEYFKGKNKTDYHLTALGYGIIAKDIEPLVVKIINENKLASRKEVTQ
jgi:acyl-CoA thioesterase-1